MSGPPVRKDGDEAIPDSALVTNRQVYRARRYVAGMIARDAADCKDLLDKLGIPDPVSEVDDHVWTGGHPYHIHRPFRRKR